MQMQTEDAWKYVDLKQNELRCLKLLADGLNIEEIALSFGLSNLAINLILNSATKKIEAKSLYQALVLATRAGLID